MTNTTQPMTDNVYKVENMQAHDDIVDNLYEQLKYLETLPDFNESCTTLYIVEAIMTIRQLRNSQAQQAQTIAELVEALEDAQESLGRFTSDEGSTQKDFDTCDHVHSVLAKVKGK